MNKDVLKRIVPSRVRWQLRKLYGRKLSGECGMFPFAQGRVPVDRIAIANHLATLYQLNSYLEIGVRNRRDMFDRVICANKIGVDPDPGAEADFKMTSDEFFATHRDLRFDLIFIDGDHTGIQVKRDIENSLVALKPGGIILLHDLNPPTAFHARETHEVDGKFPDWNGTSWEGFAAYRRISSDLDMYVIDTDWGVGFIRPGGQKVYHGVAEGYENLAADRIELLNLISVRDFLRRHPQKRLRWTPFDRLFS